MSKPVYQTVHERMSLKDFRLLFHGCDVSATVVFEVEGVLYEAVSVVQSQDESLVVNLSPVRSGKE